MDPLSIATGIITFMGVCNALASTIKKLHHLRKAPEELDELEYELMSLQSHIASINKLVKLQTLVSDPIPRQLSLDLHINSACNKVQAIQEFLESSLLNPSSNLRIRTTAWLKWESEFSRLRQELRDLRSEVGSCIGLFTAARSSEHGLQLKEALLEGRERHDQHLEILGNIQQEIACQRPLLAENVEVQLRSISDTIQATIREEIKEGVSAVAISYTGRRKSETPSNDRQKLSCTDLARPQSQSVRDAAVSDICGRSLEECLESTESATSTINRSEPRLATSQKPAQSQAVSVLPQNEPQMPVQAIHRGKSQCKRHCSCQCHRSSKLKTPDFLRQITGQLFVGYAGISNLTLPCNEHACAQRQQARIHIQYSFPVWSLMQRILTVISYAGGVHGPEKLLRMSRIRPGLDEVFIQVQSGNVSRIQQLFVRGDASPLDASDTGWSLLHYALTAGQFTTAKFLKDAGADVFAESQRRETPSDISWNRILSGRLNQKSEVLLRTLFNNDHLDNRQFTPLHKIVLGMIGKNLAEELEVSTAQIDVVDNSGYTTLAWASARGDCESVLLLLEHGATIDIANDVGQEPIHLAAQTGDVDTIRVLIQYGANVNEEVRQTCMTPIHFAAEYQDCLEQVLGLFELGAQVEGRDYLGWTPLHWACWKGHTASLNALLDSGASALTKTDDGNAPILLAVASNSHQCVHQLIKAGADCSMVRDNGWNVLHYAAIGGTVETLRALSQADLRGVDLDGLRTKDTDQTVTDMLNKRLDAFSVDEEHAAECQVWKHEWNNMMKVCFAADSTDAQAASSKMNIGDIHPGSPQPLSRSNTDSIYHDADDQPFELRTSLELVQPG
ncbi:MAG: hypothetical protein Q9222_002023 [Ikaeria aurantiellina]